MSCKGNLQVFEVRGNIHNIKNFQSFTLLAKILRFGTETVTYRSPQFWILIPDNIKNVSSTAQKMKFSIKDFFSKCDQIRRKLRIWSHILKKSLMENLIFCVVFSGKLQEGNQKMERRKVSITCRICKTYLQKMGFI